MLSLEERKERRNQIGASECYKLLNFDTQECQNLWELKIGLRDYEDFENEAMMAGNILEEDCLKFYENSNNTKLIINERIEHPRIKGFVVSLDAREEETSIPVENKVIKEDTFDGWIAKRVFNAIYGEIKLNIPRAYYCQIQAQMAVLDTEKGILNVNVLTEEEQFDPLNVIITKEHNKQVEIARNEVLIEELEKRAAYMLDCVRHKLRPSEKDYLEKMVF